MPYVTMMLKGNWLRWDLELPSTLSDAAERPLG